MVQVFFRDIVQRAKIHSYVFPTHVLKIQALIAEKWDSNQWDSEVDRLLRPHQSSMRDERFEIFVF